MCVVQNAKSPRVLCVFSLRVYVLLAHILLVSVGIPNPTVSHNNCMYRIVSRPNKQYRSSVLWQYRI